jgi:hypothetical protein
MTSVMWDDDELFEMFDADQALDDILHSLHDRSASWVLLKRLLGKEHLYYAFRPTELAAFRENYPQISHLPAMQALNLHETGSSFQTRSRRGRFQPLEHVDVPSSLRVVLLAGRDQPRSVGQVIGWAGEMTPMFNLFFTTDTVGGDRSDLRRGEQRGNGGSYPELTTASGGTTPKTTSLDVMLSARTPGTIAVGVPSKVDIRIELADGAAPLDHAKPAQLNPHEQIVVLLLVDSTEIGIEGENAKTLNPPQAGAPSTTSFTIVGKQAGISAARMNAIFQQGASMIGNIEIKVRITEQQPQRTRAAGGRVTATERDPSDDDMLSLIIEPRPKDGELRIHYWVTALPAGIRQTRFESRKIELPGTVASSATLQYVRSVYEQIESTVLENSDDKRILATDLESIGTNLSRGLFPNEFVTKLWKYRKKIQGVWVISNEPFIPWELVRLQHPETEKVDNRFLCEYGMIRWLGGDDRPSKLGHEHWAYVVGEYISKKKYGVIGGEVAYFETTLRQRGVNVRRIRATKEDILSALQAADFDILHVACHGSAQLDDINKAQLIIGERLAPTRSEKPVPIAITPTWVRGQAKLKQRKREPLVFLNACQTAQQAPSLADWGGWPTAFWDAGAGAFIGTLWSVHENAARAFAEAFYEALFNKATLREAATAGRAAAKKLKNGSWLAFVVYGQPSARFA